MFTSRISGQAWIFIGQRKDCLIILVGLNRRKTSIDSFVVRTNSKKYPPHLGQHTACSLTFASTYRYPRMIYMVQLYFTYIHTHLAAGAFATFREPGVHEVLLSRRPRLSPCGTEIAEGNPAAVSVHVATCSLIAVSSVQSEGKTRPAPHRACFYVIAAGSPQARNAHWFGPHGARHTAKQPKAVNPEKRQQERNERTHACTHARASAQSNTHNFITGHTLWVLEGTIRPLAPRPVSAFRSAPAPAGAGSPPAPPCSHRRGRHCPFGGGLRWSHATVSPCPRRAPVRPHPYRR